MIEASWIAGLGVILFGIGLIGAFSRRKAIVETGFLKLMRRGRFRRLVTNAVKNWASYLPFAWPRERVSVR